MVKVHTHPDLNRRQGINATMGRKEGRKEGSGLISGHNSHWLITGESQMMSSVVNPPHPNLYSDHSQDAPLEMEEN